MDYMLTYEEQRQRIHELERKAADQDRVQEALIRTREDWKDTFDAITDMVMVLDDEHRIIRVNTAAAEALNTTKESLVGKKCYEVIHGQDYPVEECPLLFSKKTLRPRSEEISIPTMGGTFICSTSLIVDCEGKLKGYSQVLRDITESKRIQRQLQRDQKLEAISLLSGIIAHEFNNLFMGIQGNVSLMMAEIDGGRPLYEKLKRIEEYVSRGHEVTKQLLGFSTEGKYEVRPTDVNKLVKRSADSFVSTRQEIKIYTRFQKDIWMVEADEGQIEQVLLNIYLNAWHAMFEGGELNLETENVFVEDDYAEFFGVAQGHYVKISATDTGAGMDQVTQAMIFEPFFTTKGTGTGTGLGLAFSRRTINNHGGVINVYSEKGRGTTFNIYLPASENQAIKSAQGRVEVLRGTETVLLVDDETMILDVGQEMLNEMGYKVLPVRSGSEAVEVYEKNKGEIDLVILDLIMPGVDGAKAYDQIKEINPEVKALLASGYGITSQVNSILEKGCNGFIQKPFNMRGLSQKIRKILDTT